MQVVFENMETGTNHLYPEMPCLPRAGEKLTLYREDDEPVLDGVVEAVGWSVGDCGQSIFVYVNPGRSFYPHALKSLHHTHQKILLLFYRDGKTLKEMRRELGLSSRERVRTILEAAKNNLLKEILSASRLDSISDRTKEEVDG